jgi:hypothetical protein
MRSASAYFQSLSKINIPFPHCHGINVASPPAVPIYQTVVAILTQHHHTHSTIIAATAAHCVHALSLLVFKKGTGKPAVFPKWVQF